MHTWCKHDWPAQYWNKYTKQKKYIILKQTYKTEEMCVYSNILYSRFLNLNYNKKNWIQNNIQIKSKQSIPNPVLHLLKNRTSLKFLSINKKNDPNLSTSPKRTRRFKVELDIRGERDLVWNGLARIGRVHETRGQEVSRRCNWYDRYEKKNTPCYMYTFKSVTWLCGQTISRRIQTLLWPIKLRRANFWSQFLYNFFLSFFNRMTKNTVFKMSSSKFCCHVQWPEHTLCINFGIL